MAEESNFGTLVKGFMNDLEKRESLSTRAKANKEKTVTYRCEASGIDMAVTRVLNGKDTRTLVIILSQTDDNGEPVIMMKEKDKVIEVTEKSLQSFLDGKDLETRPVMTGCTAIPKLKKGKSYIDCLWSFIHSPNCIKLAKMGVWDLECFIRCVERNGGSFVWFVKENGRYDSILTGINKMKEDDFQNVHPKIIKYAIGYMMRVFNVSYNKALEYIYTNTGSTGDNYYSTRRVEQENGRKYILNSTIKAMVVLANRYDEPFALQCFDEYMNDLNLEGLSGSKLCELLGIANTTAFRKETYYGRTSSLSNPNNIGWYPGELMKGRCPIIEERAINFEKRRLWEYILNATCVGKGKDLEGYLTLWKDYIMMSMAVDKKIKDKYPEYLQISHDIYIEKYDLVANTLEEEALRTVTEIPSKICDVGTRKYQFRVLRSPQEFCDEAAQNSNCVASYIARCSAGDTIVGSFRPKGSETTLLTVEVSKTTYDFIQIRGKYNRRATDKEMEELNKIRDKVQKRFQKYRETGKIDDDDEDGSPQKTIDDLIDKVI